MWLLFSQFPSPQAIDLVVTGYIDRKFFYAALKMLQYQH